MKVEDLVRILIVKTNPYLPFSTLNKMPYYIAIKAFVQLCKGFPEIKSIYLRHGVVEGNWVPGISDIDLTLVTDSKLTLYRCGQASFRSGRYNACHSELLINN
jgi:hypothetical protein